MIYKFTYSFNNNHCVHTCTSIKEANTFFDILLALKCEYIRINTFTKERVN